MVTTLRTEYEINEIWAGRNYESDSTISLNGSIPGVGASAVLAQASNSAIATKSGTEVADNDVAALKQTALDYSEGWYDGNAERMERALHPDLAKRIIYTDTPSGRSRLDQMCALGLVQATRRRAGQPTPKEQQQKDVTILDVYGGAASVKIVAASWVDYLHLGKFNGRWVIVNVLWELRPKAK